MSNTKKKITKQIEPVCQRSVEDHLTTGRMLVFVYSLKSITLWSIVGVLYVN